MSTDDSEPGASSALEDGKVRHELQLLAEIQGLLYRSQLPVLPEVFPAYLQKLFQSVVALRAGCQVAYMDMDKFVNNRREMMHNCWRDESHSGAQSHGDGGSNANRSAEVFSEHGGAVAEGYVCAPDVLNAARDQLEYMQLSLGQLAHIASMAMDLFAQLRAVDADFTVEDPFQASHMSMSATVDRARDTKMQAVTRCTVQLFCSEWLSDEQLLRLNCKAPSQDIMPNLFPMMLIAQAVKQSRAPLCRAETPGDKVDHKSRFSESVTDLCSRALRCYGVQLKGNCTRERAAEASMTENVSDTSNSRTREAGTCRQADMLMTELSDLLRSDGLPMLEELPPYLNNLFCALTALRLGQKYVWLGRFTSNLTEFRRNAWRLTRQAQDPALDPSALALVQAEIKVAVVLLRAGMLAALRNKLPMGLFSRGTLALLQQHSASYATFPKEMVNEALRAQLGYMQPSLEQLGRIAQLGIDMFAALRTVNAQFDAEEARQLLLPGSQRDTISVRARDAKMQAIGSCVARCQVQFHCDLGLNDMQFMRWQSSPPHSQIAQNVYPLMLVAASCSALDTAPKRVTGQAQAVAWLTDQGGPQPIEDQTTTRSGQLPWMQEEIHSIGCYFKWVSRKGHGQRLPACITRHSTTCRTAEGHQQGCGAADLCLVGASGDSFPALLQKCDTMSAADVLLAIAKCACPQCKPQELLLIICIDDVHHLQSMRTVQLFAEMMRAPKELFPRMGKTLPIVAILTTSTVSHAHLQANASACSGPSSSSLEHIVNATHQLMTACVLTLPALSESQVAHIILDLLERAGILKGVDVLPEHVQRALSRLSSSPLARHVDRGHEGHRLTWWMLQSTGLINLVELNTSSQHAASLQADHWRRVKIPQLHVIIYLESLPGIGSSAAGQGLPESFWSMTESSRQKEHVDCLQLATKRVRTR
ncbi:hypothetical protein WJX73_007448 [Symbiochloris irregularis]|uniref:Uncharacterized protein n=1 Tax=Symbiochloris irregularis TaxID=706552 RepID=A0AAW1P269_9CHLO